MIKYQEISILTASYKFYLILYSSGEKKIRYAETETETEAEAETEAENDIDINAN